MKNLLDDSRKDIAADFWTILRKYDEAAAERDKIIALKANLEAREKWLAEHANGEKRRSESRRQSVPALTARSPAAA